jgi:Lysylphosphatidylglycerol synthase TM region
MCKKPFIHQITKSPNYPTFEHMLNPILKKILNATIGIVLFGWVAYIIFGQINSNTNLQSALANLLLHHWTVNRILLLTGVAVLMIVNWSIEALKWQLLVKHLQSISFVRSLRSVFTGISVSLLTPNRIGEYGGRIIYLNDDVKLRAITANIIGSFAQFIAAALFGILGCIFYISHSAVWFMPWLLTFSVLGFLLLCLLYFKLTIFAKWLVHFSFLKKIETTILVVKNFDTRSLLK